jgi:hypothetical protein
VKEDFIERREGDWQGKNLPAAEKESSIGETIFTKSDT